MAQRVALTEQAGVTTVVASPDVLGCGAGVDAGVAGPCAVGPTVATSVPLGSTATCTQVSQNVTQAGNTLANIGTVQVQRFSCPAAPGASQNLTPVDTRVTFAQTVGAVSTVADTISIPNNKSAVLQISILGRVTAGGTSGNACLMQVSLGYENVAGTVTAFGVQGAVTVSPRDVALATATITTAIVGTTVTVAPTGVALLTVDWTCQVLVRMI